MRRRRSCSQSGDRPDLRATIDRLTDEILAAQEPSGYLNTYYVDDRKDKRFTEMYRSHELYCLGHLLQAAIAYYRATGNRKLLDGGIRYANYHDRELRSHQAAGAHRASGIRDGAGGAVSHHRRAQVPRFCRLSAQRRGARAAALDGRSGRNTCSAGFRSRRARSSKATLSAPCTPLAGATDYYAETGDAAYWATLEKLWKDLVNRKMYITGGVGSREAGESIGLPYELPNAQAYGESCAAIGNMMWNWRMLAVTGEARFADVIERALYNGINSGMSLSGTLYCYRNPLESTGEKIRNEWYDTTCCPPNLERILASLPGLFLQHQSEGRVRQSLRQFASRLASGKRDRIEDRSEDAIPVGRFGRDYGHARDTVGIQRVPSRAGMVAGYRVRGQRHAGDMARRPGEYFEIHRQWRAGDRIEVKFDMTPRLIRANPLVREDAGRVALAAWAAGVLLGVGGPAGDGFTV